VILRTSRLFPEPDDRDDVRATYATRTSRFRVRRLFPDREALYQRRGWRLLPSIERVYSNEQARRELDWSPRCDFQRALDHLLAGEDPRSPLAVAVGAKGWDLHHALTRTCGSRWI
jgi:hypothetical protein